MSQITNMFHKTTILSQFFTKTVSKINMAPISVRTLYSQPALGLDGYINTRERAKTQFNNMTDKFRTKMSEYINDASPKTMIFTEDLKNMIHLAEDETDVELVVKMMEKFNKQNKELRFGNYVFGPVVMRMFYYLNKPDDALKCFQSEELTGFFDQIMSYQILLDLLYENGRYDDVLKAFELIKTKQIQGSKYAKNVVVLTFAACYKKNTPEALKFALDLWKELHEVGHIPMRKAVTFCAGLALNQKNYEAALEIISSVPKQNYITVRSIKAIALAEIGRIEDSLSILRSLLDRDIPQNTKHTFSKDVIDSITKAVETIDDQQLKQEFTRIKKILSENGHIVSDSLDSQLCTVTEAARFDNKNQQGYNNYNNTNPNRMRYQGNRTQTNYRPYNQRPGLRDMS